MADEVPYMMQVGNIPAIFAKIRSAGTPRSSRMTS
jgi:hypothetical protein